MIPRRKMELPSWGIPFSYAVIALVVGLTLPRIESHWLPGIESGMNALISDLISALPQERHKPLQQYRLRLNATIAMSFENMEDRQEALIEDRQGLGTPRIGGTLVEIGTDKVGQCLQIQSTWT